METSISSSAPYTISISFGDTSQGTRQSNGVAGGQPDMQATDIRDSQDSSSQPQGVQESDQNLEKQLATIVSALKFIDQLMKKLTGDNGNGKQDSNSLGSPCERNDAGGDQGCGGGDINNAGGGNAGTQSAGANQSNNDIGSGTTGNEPSRVEGARRSSGGNTTGANQGSSPVETNGANAGSAGNTAGATQGSAPVETNGAKAGPAPSQFAPRSLDEPDLPAEDVKARINGAVDRHWDQVSSSFNFENSPEGKQKAYAFFQGAASRESGTGDTMRTNLITGEGSSYSKGPLQTANTAYANNGHPDWIKDSHVPGHSPGRPQHE